MERPYIINHRLVRGLDYYTKTVFEVWAQGIGAQSAVCGGGRYDGLAEELGGAPMPGIGFGSGMERLVLAMKEQGIQVPGAPAPQVVLAYLGEPAKLAALQVLTALREAGIRAVVGFGDRSCAPSCAMPTAWAPPTPWSSARRSWPQDRRCCRV